MGRTATGVATTVKVGQRACVAPLPIRRSVWVRGDRPPQPAAEQRRLFGRVLMPQQHWQWPGAWAHAANDSLRPDLANLVVHESLVMGAVQGCPFPRFAEGRWWYGPGYWA